MPFRCILPFVAFSVAGILLASATAVFGAPQQQQHPSVVSEPTESAELPSFAEQLFSRAKHARDANSSRLKSAKGSGRLTQVVNESEQLEPIEILDTDIDFYFQAPKFRLQLVHTTRLIEQTKPDGQTDQEYTRWIPSEIQQQIILFDGEQVVSLEYLNDKQCRGTIDSAFRIPTIMRAAGFPFDSPVECWKPTLTLEDFDELDPASISVKPLDNGGFLGQVTKNTYFIKFFFLDRFGYDLRRVSSYRTGETRPFRDYLMSWEQSNGVYYVQHYSNIWTSAARNTASNAPDSKRLSVEYHSFEANIAIDDALFDMQSVLIPEGSRFLDKRTYVNGGPQELVYRNAQLRSP